MNKKERVMLTIGIGILLFVVLMIMTGCSDSAGFQDEGWSTESIPLLDGRVVTCVLYDGFDGDTITCDWEGAAHDELEYVVIPQ
jgi:hypothetical protein